jgi:hypothetical protein
MGKRCSLGMICEMVYSDELGRERGRGRGRESSQVKVGISGSNCWQVGGGVTHRGSKRPYSITHLRHHQPSKLPYSPHSQHHQPSSSVILIPLTCQQRHTHPTPSGHSGLPGSSQAQYRYCTPRKPLAHSTERGLCQGRRQRGRSSTAHDELPM